MFVIGIYYWRDGDGKLYKIEVTPEQQAYIMGNCDNFNDLHDYLSTLAKWVRAGPVETMLYASRGP